MDPSNIASIFRDKYFRNTIGVAFPGKLHRFSRCTCDLDNKTCGFGKLAILPENRVGSCSVDLSVATEAGSLADAPAALKLDADTWCHFPIGGEPKSCSADVSDVPHQKFATE